MVLEEGVNIKKINYNTIIKVVSVLLPQYCSGDKIEKDEMGWACSTYGVEERHIQDFGGKT